MKTFITTFFHLVSSHQVEINESHLEFHLIQMEFQIEKFTWIKWKSRCDSWISTWWLETKWKKVVNPEIIKKRLKFCQDHQYKTNFEKWVLTDETHFWFKNYGEKRWIMKGKDYIQLTKKKRKSKDLLYVAFSKHKKYSLSFFFKDNMDSYTQCVKKIIPEITES